MNRRLVIMRHAHSSRDAPNLQDHDRPLDSRGLRDAPSTANEILRCGWKPDKILVSTSLRTTQTFDALGSEFSDLPREFVSGLYLAPIQVLLSISRDLDDDSTTMIIGHNPGCEMLLESLTGNLQVMPTASAALIREEGDSWNLINFIRPKDLI